MIERRRLQTRSNNQTSLCVSLHTVYTVKNIIAMTHFNALELLDWFYLQLNALVK